MVMRFFLYLWLLLAIALSFEYWALNFHPSLSLLHLSPEPGRPLSLWLGWVGLGLMVIMNVYSLRKRISGLGGWGRLSSWLNFHVFCGLVGPTLILFHCNFKVRGLVAISFWSMITSFSSGIIGRYF